MPTIFLCHATEDKRTVERVARDFVAAGIETFYDEWEMRVGDSLRQRIEAGIDNCTHFAVVLSPASITKPWVNLELDAGLDQHLRGRCRLVPLRLGLAPEDMPVLLRGRYAPSIDDLDAQMDRIIADIFEVRRRPPLGLVPAYVVPTLPPHHGVSTIAGRIARHMVEVSENGWNDPRLSADDLRQIARVPDDHLLEAIVELEDRGWARRAVAMAPLGLAYLAPLPALFVDLDSTVMPVDHENDARTLAAKLVNGVGSFVLEVEARQLGWPPRRINPAVAFLLHRGLVERSNTIEPVFASYQISRNARTRRFLQDT